MQASYAPTTAFTKLEEGGYSSDPEDSGNWSSGETGVGIFIGSNLGCGAPATIAYMAATQPGFVVTATWMQALPEAVYDGMAQTGYWNPLQGNALMAGLDLACFDFGWNTGIGSAAKRLQWLIGASQDGEIGPETLGLTQSCALAPIAKSLAKADAETLQGRLGVNVDGDVGPETLAALEAQPQARAAVLLLGLGEAQTAYYRGLSNFSTYGTGWLARTGRRVTAGLALAGGTTVDARFHQAAVAFTAKSLRLARPAPPAIEAPNAKPWVPFEPGVPIAKQEIMMKHILVASAFAGALALGACSVSQLSESSALVNDLSDLLTLAESDGSVSAANGLIVSDVINGIDSLAATTSASVTGGAGTESTVITSLESSIKSVAADLPSDTTVQSDAANALKLLADVPTNSSASALNQAEAAVGTFVVDYLTAGSPASAAVGAAPSPAEQLIIDARKRITALS
jgi:lysozyme family protein